MKPSALLEDISRRVFKFQVFIILFLHLLTSRVEATHLSHLRLGWLPTVL